MKLISCDLIDQLILRAAAGLESYFRPHRHLKKWECTLVMRGLFDIILFDDNGSVTERISVGPEGPVVAFEIPPNIWHSWVPMVDIAQRSATTREESIASSLIVSC